MAPYQNDNEFHLFEVILLNCLARSLRILLDVPPDGHCGILCLMLPEFPFNGAPPHDHIIYEGRTRMADAYRNHGAGMVHIFNDHFSSFDLQTRIQVHDAMRDAFCGCENKFYVDAYYDLVAWSIATGKKIGLVRQKHMEVLIFSGLAYPTRVRLDEYTPEPEDLVLYHVNNNHYQSLFYPAESVVTTDNIIDEIFQMRNKSFPSLMTATLYYCRA